MTGVLATGFAQEERRREYLRVWDQVARVPLFASLGVVTHEMLTGRTLRWNPDRQDFIGDPAASALLGRSYREPWKLEV